MKKLFCYKALWIAFSIFSIYACRHAEHEHEEGGHEESGARHPHGVIHFSEQQAEEAGLEWETVAVRPFSACIPVSGQVLAAGGNEQTLIAPASGTVGYARTALGEGMAVRRRETLFYIHPGATLDGDQAVRVQTEYEAARLDFERAGRLLQDRLIPVRNYEAAKSRAEQARAACEALESRKTGAGNIAVTSDIDGFLKSVSVAAGEYVTAGQPMAIVTGNRRLLLRAEVPERYFSSLSGALSANFRLPYSSVIYKTDELHGRAISVGTVSGAESPYIPVTFEFDNAGDILAGGYAEVWLLCAGRTDAISVPAGALTEEQGIYFVYLKADTDDYRKQEVEIGRSDGARVEILRGLRPGDQVVVRGACQVRLASMSSVVPEGHNHNH